MKEELSINGLHARGRKAIFLVDALISATFALLLLSASINLFKTYKVVSYDTSISRSADLLFLTSTKAIMSSKDPDIGSGNICILRVYHGVRRVCGEAI